MKSVMLILNASCMMLGASFIVVSIFVSRDLFGAVLGLGVVGISGLAYYINTRTD